VNTDLEERHARRLRTVAFDLDAASLTSLREALPEWEIEVANGATAASLVQDWDPGAADLLVVNAREEVAETLGAAVSPQTPGNGRRKPWDGTEADRARLGRGARRFSSSCPPGGSPS
jgi:hypothetical protein